MSNIKQEVQWSPIHQNQFISWGNEIHLYETVATEKVDGPHVSLSHLTAAQLLATNSAHHYLKCVDIYPKEEKDTLLAVGQANGKVNLTTFGPSIYDTTGLTGLEFRVKLSRQCNAVGWRPIDGAWLAGGFEKYRGDAAVAVWDIEAGGMARTEAGQSDTCHALAWTAQTTLAVALSNKAIKIIDLNEPTKAVASCQTKAVYGLTASPDNQLASFIEHQVAIWDLRNLVRPLVAIQKNKPVIKIAWCPTRKNLLGIVVKDSSLIDMVDVAIGKNEPSIIERSVNPGLSHPVASFSWHPNHHNRILAVSIHGTMVDYLVSERVTLSWGSAIAWTTDSKTLELMSPSDELCHAVGDITSAISSRVVNRYGLLPALSDNADLVDSVEVKGLWRWLEESEALVSSGIIESPTTRHPGVRCVLGMESTAVAAGLLSSETDFLPWCTTTPTYKAKVFRRDLRDKALKLCGWNFVYNPSELQSMTDSLVEGGEMMKAVAYNVFGLNLKSAILILANNPELSTVAMALSGFTTEKNSVWRKMCMTLCGQLTDPYLRMIFAFLTSDTETYDQVFVETKVDVADRVGFALTFLSDVLLTDYINQLTESLTAQGCLSGILLTGMTIEAIPLLQQYIDLTGDVQTASVVCIRAMPTQLLNNDRVQYWLECYRELADRLRLWEGRAEIDCAAWTAAGNRPPPVVIAVCNYCGGAMGGRRLATHQHSRHRPVATNHNKVTCCPHCRKAQPRCSICLANMGCDGSSPFDNWYTWCQTCRHGGHVAHISAWFKEETECPVTGCTCPCMSLDPVGVLPSVR